MQNPHIFHKNLEKWASHFPDQAKLLQEKEVSNLEFYIQPNGEINLIKKGQENCSWHALGDVFGEAERWFNSLQLSDSDLLYVYGVGLGYYYLGAKAWLKSDPKNRLIFLEDDLEVIRLFFETELATEMLLDQQVSLVYLDKTSLTSTLSALSEINVLHSFKISSLAFYLWSKPELFQEISNNIYYFHDLRSQLVGEYLSLGQGFLTNFYSNWLLFPSSGLGSSLFGKFKGIPAIVCGAGPSLEKNIDLLKTLTDRALIFAGGTSLNALNSRNLLAHFGLGIDPNISFYKRIISNRSFETPFFYRNRMNHAGLELVHGKRLYIPGAGGYDQLATWFEEKFAVKSDLEISEGHNVVNFSLSLAKALGCNPIILVGLDLAYSNDKPYCSGIFQHVLVQPKEGFRSKNLNEELIRKDDIYGKPVYTLWKWIHESLWYTEFAASHPETQIVNATEGGIGFLKIPNLSLKEVALKYLSKSFDFDGLLHTEIQDCTLPTQINTETILKALEEITKNLLVCKDLCQQIVDNLYLSIQKLIGDDEESDFHIDALVESLKKEMGYEVILSIFDRGFSFIFDAQFNEEVNEKFHSKETIKKQKIIQSLKRYRYFQDVIDVNIHVLRNLFNDFLQKNKLFLPVPIDTLNLIEKLRNLHQHNYQHEQYSFEEGVLKILDADCQVSIQETISEEVVRESRKVSYYPDQQTIKSEHFYLDEQLHGPSTFYSKEGKVLSQSWYSRGKKEGKAFFYTTTGRLLSLQRFREGERHGTQEYYYDEGLPKSLINYANGYLHGDLLLFHSNGHLFRELHFNEGSQEGVEKMWSEEGLLTLEADYKDGHPIGRARQWYFNGNLAKEFFYNENGSLKSMRSWNISGHIEDTQNRDFFDNVSDHTEKLTNTLEKLYNEIHLFASQTYAPKDSSLLELQKFKKIQEDLFHLKRQMDQLRISNNLITKESTEEGEAIWKTLNVQKGLEHQLEEVAVKMSKDLQNIESLLTLTTEIIRARQIGDNEDEQLQK